MFTNHAEIAGTGTRRARLGFAAFAVIGVLGSAIPLTAYPTDSKATKPALKVYISVDMEGVAGAVTADQLLPGGFEYERFRRFMTDEALAAVRGAKAAGATEVVVSDSHGNGDLVRLAAINGQSLGPLGRCGCGIGWCYGRD